MPRASHWACHRLASKTVASPRRATAHSIILETLSKKIIAPKTATTPKPGRLRRSALSRSLESLRFRIATSPFTSTTWSASEAFLRSASSLLVAREPSVHDRGELFPLVSLDAFPTATLGRKTVCLVSSIFFFFSRPPRPAIAVSFWQAARQAKPVTCLPTKARLLLLPDQATAASNGNAFVVSSLGCGNAKNV